MSGIVEIINSNPKMIFNKSDENIKTNMRLLDIFRDSDTLLCPQSAVEVAEIYWEHKFAVDELLTHKDEIAIGKDDFKEIVFRYTFICDSLEKICSLDEKNGGSRALCANTIKDKRSLDFSDFREKSDMIHLKIRQSNEDVSLKSRLRNLF